MLVPYGGTKGKLPKISGESGDDIINSARRAFTRLTALASWRSEYILRTRLLGSLARGKPGNHIGTNSFRRASGQSSNATVTYNSSLLSTISHLHANFGDGLKRKALQFIHGSDHVGKASISDPTIGKIDNWGSSDPQAFFHFSDRFPNVAEWGLHPGNVIGVPNSMDVSQPYGMVYAEGSPGGMVYYRSTEEKRGRFLAASSGLSDVTAGIPRIQAPNESICAIWIAKSSAIPVQTGGLIGILSGSSSGILTSYTLGTDGSRDQRFPRGEMTARWALSPGVPIIAIVADDLFSSKRRTRGRIWVVVLNALGEVFCLTNVPERAKSDRAAALDQRELERIAWDTGRTVTWNLVEPTRRIAKPDPYHEATIDGSYSPRSSSNTTGLSTEQIIAETDEIEAFLSKRPRHFQAVCQAWDMRRKIEVDFAAGDVTDPEESFVLISAGHDKNSPPDVKRFTRTRFEQMNAPDLSSSQANLSTLTSQPSIFGGKATHMAMTINEQSMPSKPEPSTIGSRQVSLHLQEVWTASDFSIKPYKNIKLTAIALDMSTYALMSLPGDPLLKMNGTSVASSPIASPSPQAADHTLPTDIPGQYARYIAIGTNTGVVFVWNIRAPRTSGLDIVDTITPLRVIHTESPCISCLAISALYLVHGGSDGLVQAWDPLASTQQPLRTLHSRFSGRARRRLIQAQGSAQGIGVNMFGAGVIALDPDPTKLRGVVSLGTQLRFWSYSSVTADQYTSRKRKLRRSPRSSNGNASRFTTSSRAALKDYIANEQSELRSEQKKKKQEEARLHGRFGVGLLGDQASEEDVLAYALLLSEETFNEHEERRRSGSDGSDTVTPEPSVVGSSSSSIPEGPELDDEGVAEALRLSLQESNASLPLASTSYDVPIRYVKPKRQSSRSPPRAAAVKSDVDPIETDLDFALRLSLAEERSRVEAGGETEDYPALSAGSLEGKGKTKSFE